MKKENQKCPVCVTENLESDKKLWYENPPEYYKRLSEITGNTIFLDDLSYAQHSNNRNITHAVVYKKDSKWGWDGVTIALEGLLEPQEAITALKEKWGYTAAISPMTGGRIR